MANPTIFITSVEDYFAHTAQYIVRDPGGSPINVIDLQNSPLLPVGVRPISQYPIKTQVLCLKAEGIPVGIILGAIGFSASDPRMLLPDSIVLRSCAGFPQDPMHHGPYTDPQNSLGNYSAGRPFDVVAGDWGGINDLGVAVFLGRLMAAIKASDAAKVETFWGDDLLRLTGYNLEEFTSCREKQDFNDEGESCVIERATPFPWEAMGLKNIGEIATKVGGRVEIDSENANYEPKQRDQMIIPRFQKLSGYLGDFNRKWISLPPTNLGSTETYDNPSVYNGLLEITENLNGAYHVRSAKSISLEKYCLIPVPKQMIQPDDPLGDTVDTYAPAGQTGQGDKYDLKEFKWGDNSPTVRAAQLYDMQTWFVNWYASPGITKHLKDWKYPEESELKDISAVGALYNKSVKSGHKFTLDLPAFTEVKIDDRQDHTSKYYASRAGFHILDDGSIVIEDGYGSQIIMSGGNIYSTCVGDMIQLLGRSAITWAARDAIVKAGNAVDVSAAKGDLRLKADKNLHMLGGNSETVGGVLIECRSKGTESADNYKKVGAQVTGQGITIKSADSSVNIFGKDMYISRGQKKAGQLVIDAGKEGSLLMFGKQVTSQATQVQTVSVLDDNETKAQTLVMNKTQLAVTNNMQITGDVTIVEGEISKGNMLVGGGLIVYESASVRGGVVGDSKETKKERPQETISAQIKDAVEVIDTQIKTQKETIVDSATTSPGNDDFQKAIGFSCRSTKDDLKLDNTFVIYEARWQQFLRIRGEDSVKWEEPEVKAPNGEITMPHPGYEGWQTLKAFATIELSNFDMSSGMSKARAGLTEKGQPSKASILKGNYPVNVQT